MGVRTVIPFGPQHPVLPEPIHLDLVMEDERVVEAIPSIGFVHRGLEKLAEKREFQDMVYVAERICGICSFMHAMTYCQALEEVLGVQVPDRARFLRVFWSELSRVHSHLLWLGLLADSFGFESLFMHCWRLRERILDIVEETTGGRVIFGSCKPGGVRCNVGDEALKRIAGELSKIAAEVGEVIDVFAKDDSSRKRLSGVGVLAQEDAHSLGAVGPTARGSGIHLDCRQAGYAAYRALKWEPVVETAGDCHARALVRIREIRHSFDMLQQVIALMPAGPIEAKVSGNPKGDCFMRVEQPRGEVVHYIRGNGTKNLERFRVRTPTFANIPALVKMLQGCDLAEVPVIVLSIDPCISCTER
jgi:ech hydrogenase subunit E